MKDSTPVTSLDIDRVEIVVDSDYADKVELYILDEKGDRIEGGTFDLPAFMDHILRFYNARY